MNLSSILFIILPILVFIAFDWGVKKAVASKDFDSRIITQARIFFISWYTIVSYIGTKGMLNKLEPFPSPLIYFLICVFLLSLILSATKIGEAVAQLDWHYIVGFHGFRILMELSIYAAYMEDLAPIQMTFMGLNFNILSGILALVIAPSLIYRSRLRLIKLWNYFSLLLLLSSIAIYVLSIPSPFQYFQTEQSMAWISPVPYIYLPGILIFFAFFGHWIVFKKIKSYEY